MGNLSRRDFVKLTSTIGAGLLISPWSQASRLLSDRVRPRVVVIGGGIAGISTAWLLDSECDVILLEKNDHIGGHAHTVSVGLGEKSYSADLGAQFVSPKTHPHYMALLEQLGLYDPSRPDGDAMYSSRMTMTFLRSVREVPVFVSPLVPGRVWPVLRPWNWCALEGFAQFRKYALRFERNDGDRMLSVRDWLSGLPISERHKNDIVLPLLTTMQGCSTFRGS